MNVNSFRLWDKENKEYYKPTYEAYNGKLEYITLSQFGRLSMITLDLSRHIKVIDESMFPDRFIIERFTGLLDKHKKEIYEGNIFKTCDPLTTKYGIIEVGFEDGQFVGYPNWLKNREWCPLNTWLNDCVENWLELIGNIHDNPELLKEKDNV